MPKRDLQSRHISNRKGIINQTVGQSQSYIYTCTPEYINVGLMKKTTLFILDKNGV